MTSPKSCAKVLFTGPNTAGSWTMRGEQVSSTRRGWEARQTLGRRDWHEFDIFVFVKRPDIDVMKRLHALGKLVVYDVIDSWKQPEEGLRVHTPAEARALFAQKWRGMPVDGFIFANAAMHGDLTSVCKVPTTYIYHHYRSEYETPPGAVAEKVTTVGYEGNVGFLGPWQAAIAEACGLRGWNFEINPVDITKVDIGIAVRGGEHDSFLANRYKSNVKLANFIGAGIPCIVGDKERSYHETDEGSVRFFQTPAQLARHLDALVPALARQVVRDRFIKARERYQLSTISEQYEAFFRGLMSMHGRGLAC
jgi:hypothetical protein